ncbi:poly-gamma-glutamate hydrolase family protein [Amycolatopsis sp. H20-H5]|uniref:poly-gamma-glutamate hydrolase family protein n=1 Tax=Amycolatopsis sp. H20-H5 TaxID=3046309 RepID=UPI002DB6303B|nr:poly-gamma-glutamate hydrolase family protein [Amycolatopsis sp. H20-H5]MEC3975083.1 poly-gamma-glutamate hydrolase family protein [Amycolatopsis sp. H20-H5]
MAPPYSSYAALAAEQVEGIAYTRTQSGPPGTGWSAIAIHGGAIEAGTGELAREIAGSQMARYEFAGIKPSGNTDLHITSGLFDEPQCLALIGSTDRTVSVHGFAGTAGIAETALGGLDTGLRDKISAALAAAGFSVGAAPSELGGSDPSNICNRNRSGAGVQLELSNALRASFFPGGDLSAASRASGVRTPAFYAYAAAVKSVMGTTATYLADLSRVRIAFTGLNTDADYAKVERTTDGITWSTVRGGDTVALIGGAGKIDDYEFAAGVANTYRMTAVDSAPVTSLGTGAIATGNNATLTPALPAGTLPTTGTILLLLASHRATGATITTPTGWTRLAGGFSNVAAFYRTYAAGLAAPTVAFTGGAAGDSCTAQIRAFTNATTPVHLAVSSNSAAQDVVYPAASVAADATVWVLQQWKQSASTGATQPVPAFSDQQGGSNTTGTNAESMWSWRTNAAANLRILASGVSTYTGGSSAISRSRLLYVPRRAVTDRDTAVITPVPASVWLKNPSRPSLNTAVTVTGVSDVDRPDRGAEFDIVGRTLPVAVTDVMGSRRVTLTITTATLAAAADMDRRLSAGEPVFVQAPGPACAVPTLYAVVKGFKQAKHSRRTVRRFFELPLIEVAAPGSTVYGDTYVYADVLASYTTYGDLLGAVTTYSNLIDKVSTGEVIVP